MTLTSIDQIAIRDLLKQIESILGSYDESPYDQIDNLRAKISEASDITEDTSHYDVGEEDDSFESLRTEQLGNLEEEFRYTQLN